MLVPRGSSLLLLLLAAATLTNRGASQVTSGQVHRPNAVPIMTDDQGYGDFSRHSGPALRTPNMDKLAEQSIRFTDLSALVSHWRRCY